MTTDLAGELVKMERYCHIPEVGPDSGPTLSVFSIRGRHSFCSATMVIFGNATLVMDILAGKPIVFPQTHLIQNVRLDRWHRYSCQICFSSSA